MVHACPRCEQPCDCMTWKGPTTSCSHQCVKLPPGKEIPLVPRKPSPTRQR
jgi:hypothetical protein